MQTRCAQSHLAFTLIEALAVIVILSASMVAALGAAQGIGGSKDRRMAEMQLKSAIGHARQLSLREGGAVLELGDTLTVTGISSAENSRRAYELPSRVFIYLDEHDAESPGVLQFDAAGRAMSDGLMIDLNDAGTLSCRFDGVTCALVAVTGTEGAAW